MFNLSNVWSTIKIKTGEKSPEIVMGIGVAGLLCSIVMGIAATPKAVEKIEEIHEKPMNKKDLTKAYATRVLPLYVPTITTAVVSTGCVIFSDRMHEKRNAALAAAYTVSEEMLKEYRAKVVEKIGKTKEAEVRHEIAQDTIDKNVEVIKHVYTKNDEEVIFVDDCTKLAFTATINDMDALRNRMNAKLLQEEFISISDIAYEIPDLYAQIKKTPALYGDIDYSGVNLSKGLIEEYGENYWRYEPGSYNNKPVFVWYHNSYPRERYW